MRATLNPLYTVVYQAISSLLLPAQMQFVDSKRVSIRGICQTWTRTDTTAEVITVEPSCDLLVLEESLGSLPLARLRFDALDHRYSGSAQ